MKQSLAIVGYGKVGTAFGQFLSQKGYNITGFSKRDVSGESGDIKFSDKPYEITKNADIVLVTTPDGVIESVCEEISDKNGFKEGAVVLHSSGALPSTLLKSAKKCNAYIGSIHPLQSIASKEFDKNPFKGAVFAIEGEEKAVETAISIAKTLDGNPFKIRTDSKTLYHASAVVASNYLVSLVDFSISLLKTAGIPEESCFSVIEPLIRGTVGNIEKNGTKKALTGPIARGDEKTVHDHIIAIKNERSDLLKLYNVLGDYTVGIADKSLTEGKKALLKKIFSE